MANEEHLALLKQGVEQWNEWRKRHPEMQPDLYRADLSRTDLSNIDLSGMFIGRAKLSETNLQGANLSGALLNRADLNNANLNKANLKGTLLNRADLSDANLVDADLRDADLIEANLRRANMSGAKLYRATIWETVFANTDLRQTKGLCDVKHYGPSHIELSTVQLPQDGSALHFLCGCGVPDEWIDFYRAQTMHPIQYHSCFISYSSKDETLARRLYADLQAHGVRCWYAEEDLKIGDHYHQRIDEAIRLYNKLILVLSDAAVNSAWVEREVVAAREKEDHQQREVLFPLRLDDAVMQTNKAWAADVRRRWHIGDFTHWKDHDRYQQAFDRLLRDLKAETKGEKNG